MNHSTPKQGELTRTAGMVIVGAGVIGLSIARELLLRGVPNVTVVEVEGTATIKSLAFEIAPALESTAIVDSWAGFRPHAIDDLPVLGRAAEVDGLFHATGHYRNGILLAPITANVIVDAVVNTKRSPFLEIFSPDRFRLAAAGR